MDFVRSGARQVFGVALLGLLFYFTLGAMVSTQAQYAPYIYQFYSQDTYSNIGPAGGKLTIEGYYFTGATSVKIGSVSVAFTVNSDSTITATAPSGLVGGYGQISVTNPYGTGALYSWYANSFYYVYGSPPNDYFANATDLGTSNNTVITGSNVAAHSEPNEQGYDSGWWKQGHCSVWWKWTPAVDGQLQVIDTTGSSFETRLDVYTGTSLSNLVSIRSSQEVGGDRHSRVSFPATKGTVYYIRVSTADKNNGYRGYGSWSSGGPTYTMYDINEKWFGSIAFQMSSYPPASTDAGHLLWARALLESSGDSKLANKAENLAAVNTHLDTVLSSDPMNSEANFLKAFVRIGLLQRQAAFAQLLTSMGVTESKGDVIHPHYLMPQDAQGIAQFASGANTSLVLSYLQQVVVPVIDEAETNFSRIGTGFSTSYSESETYGRSIHVDYADIQVWRAIFQAVKAASYFTETYDLAVSLQSAAELARNKKSNIENYKLNYTNLLKFVKSEKRRSMANALQNASLFYQNAATWAAANRTAPADRYQNFRIDEKLRTNLNSMSASLDHEVIWGGNRINLSALLNTTTPLRDLLGTFKDNGLLPSSSPDATFAGCYPEGNLPKFEGMLRKNGGMASIATYAEWASTYLPKANAQDQSPTANPTGDGISNEMKYIFGLDPLVSHSTSEISVTEPVTDTATNKTYLTLRFVRRIDITTINYVVAVSDDLVTWDVTQSQLEQVGSPVRNEDGFTETVTVRVKSDLSLTSRKFLRIQATDVSASSSGSGIPGSGGITDPVNTNRGSEVPPTTRT